MLREEGPVSKELPTTELVFCSQLMGPLALSGVSVPSAFLLYPRDGQRR